MNEPLFLTLSEVLQIHAYQVETFGGSSVVLDQAKLDSAVAQPHQAFSGSYLHEDFASMAAAYLFHIVKNHPFEDGNKRTGAHAALVFLEINGIDVDMSNDELFNITIQVADGRMDKPALIAEFRRLLTTL